MARQHCAVTIQKITHINLFLAVYPTANTDIDLYHAVPVGGSAVLQSGISQGALGDLYSPQWFHNELQPVDVRTPGSRFEINRGFNEDFNLTIFFATLDDNGTYVCGVDVNGEHYVESPTIRLLVYGQFPFTIHTLMCILYTHAAIDTTYIIV